MSPKKRARKPAEPEPGATELQALETFHRSAEVALNRLRAASETIQELLGRWEQLVEGQPGLLGGNLLALLNETVLEEQLERLTEGIHSHRRAPEDVAEHADFFAGVVGEYAALLKVLASIELDEGNPLAKDWERVTDDLLQHAGVIQQEAERLEIALEGEEDAAEDPAAGMRTVSRKFLQEVWQQAQAGGVLEGVKGRLAEILRQHPEYRVAWESPEPLQGSDYTQEGVNPFVHVTMHAAVESQVAENEPPEVRHTLERLTAAGTPRHEAIHRIAYKLVEQIWNMQKERRGFDRAAYIRALHAL